MRGRTGIMPEIQEDNPENKIIYLKKIICKGIILKTQITERCRERDDDNCHQGQHMHMKEMVIIGLHPVKHLKEKHPEHRENYENSKKVKY